LTLLVQPNPASTPVFEGQVFVLVSAAERHASGGGEGQQLANGIGRRRGLCGANAQLLPLVGSQGGFTLSVLFNDAVQGIAANARRFVDQDVHVFSWVAS
jgi:hypothetical protein